jgi:hypothetical protein
MGNAVPRCSRPSCQLLEVLYAVARTEDCLQTLLAAGRVVAELEVLDVVCRRLQAFAGAMSLYS